MTSRRLLAALVAALVVGLLVAAPILSGGDLATLTPEVSAGGIELGAVNDVHENAHSQPIVVDGQDAAVLWFDPRWDGAPERFSGHLEWREGEGLTAVRMVDPVTGEPTPWCITSGLFEAADGAAFNDLGERVAGGHGRGLDRYPVALVDAIVVIDTTRVLDGPPRDGRLGYEGARGPRCVERPRPGGT